MTGDRQVIRVGRPLGVSSFSAPPGRPNIPQQPRRTRPVRHGTRSKPHRARPAIHIALSAQALAGRLASRKRAFSQSRGTNDPKAIHVARRIASLHSAHRRVR